MAKKSTEAPVKSAGNDYEGYKAESIAIMKKFGVKTWSRIRIESSNGTSEGIILPRNKFAPDNYIEIKLKNGYNIGIPIDESTKMTLIEQTPPMEVKFKPSAPQINKNLPNIKLLGTGGTIASRLDYVTGGVIPAFEPAELFAAVPELSQICNLDTEVMFKIFSEDMVPDKWLEMAHKVAKAANSGVDGIMIGHGTDTMSYTTAALSFLLKDLSVPVVVVGSQRSSDRPSSDAALNLINAATVAGKANLAEVVLCMLGSSNHSYGFIHRGTRVRKMHSSVRHTFRTIGDTPLGMVQNGQVSFFKSDVRSRPTSKIQTTAAKKIESKIGLVYAYPGIPPEIIDLYIDKGYKGIVIAGTGLGHVPHTMIPALERAKDAHIPVVMTLQTLWGFTGMDVYETGREEQAVGVIPGQNMLPETAVAKLAWLLGNYDNEEEIRTLIATNIAGEITSGEPPNGFQVLQGVEHRIQ
jgi:glutamyl-tRNA(Gln) amidotransferase subunit D